jgi:hypothetical protein
VLLLGIFVRLGYLLRVGAEYGRECAELEPAHVELGVDGIFRVDCKTAYVMAHVAHSGKSGVEHDGDLRLKSAP